MEDKALYIDIVLDKWLMIEKLILQFHQISMNDGDDGESGNGDENGYSMPH